MTSTLDPTRRVSVTSFRRGIWHGLRGTEWTWCGRRINGVILESPAVVITCRQCLRRGPQSRGEA